MRTLFAQMLAAQARGEDCMFVSIVASRGSVPRGAGSHMLVGAAGRICGTIGGGAVEGRCIEQAKGMLQTEALPDETRCMQTFSLDKDDQQNLGMVCGGQVTVRMRRVRRSDEAIAVLAKEALARFETGTRTHLVEEMDSGALSLVSGQEVLGAPLPHIIQGIVDRPQILDAAGKRYYTELLVRDERVWVFGGGHVAQALVPLLAGLDFRCVVVEDRAEFADAALFPGAEAVCLLQVEEWEKKIHIGSRDCVCIMTRGHKSDLEGQAFALRSPAAYIGVIGSRRKIAETNEKLRALGFTDAQIARIITPIGLSIGAVTPAEIAVSIAAQLIAHRNAQR